MIGPITFDIGISLAASLAVSTGLLSEEEAKKLVLLPPSRSYSDEVENLLRDFGKTDEEIVNIMETITISLTVTRTVIDCFVQRVQKLSEDESKDVSSGKVARSLYIPLTPPDMEELTKTLRGKLISKGVMTDSDTELEGLISLFIDSYESEEEGSMEMFKILKDLFGNRMEELNGNGGN